MKPARQQKKPPAQALPAKLLPRQRFYALVCGIWLGLSLLKFGNPIIFGEMIGWPADLAEFIFTPWPTGWGYVMLIVVSASSLALIRPRFDRQRHWLVAMLGFWLLWQFLSSARSVDPRLSNLTLLHFASCAVVFVVGWWALAPLRASPWFWTPLLIGFFYVLFNGFDQHAGGLEATRKAFYAQTNWQSFPKEYILRVESNRVFSTFITGNTFAGVLLLLLPSVLWQAWQLTARWPRVLRGVLVGLLVYLGLACFYWTGSKGGWLIALVVAGVAALQTPAPKRLKIGLIAVGMVIGLTVFFIRFSAYFEKGATSVSARFEYWRAAVQIVKDRPILGSGPGTFSVLFRSLKRPDAEMAKLVHNDYLEQACDSGVPGGIAFFVAITGLLWNVRPRGELNQLDGYLWLGLLGWGLQGFIEFSLYIPAIAWPAFLFLGALLGAMDETEFRPSPRPL